MDENSQFSGLCVGYNFYNTAFYPVKLMRELERKQDSAKFKRKLMKLVEISGLDWWKIGQLILKKDSEKFHQTVNFLEFSKKLDVEKFLKTYSALYSPLIVQCKHKDEKPLNEFLENLKSFLSYYQLQDKNLILLGSPPKSCQEAKTLEEAELKPNKILKVVHNSEFQCPEASTNVIKELKYDKFEEINDRINLCSQVRKNFQFSNPFPSRSGRWSPKITFIGLRGSGATLQATMLAKDLHLIFIDADRLCERESHLTDYKICSLIYERLLRPDCLRHGYVLVNFPRNLIQLQFLLSTEMAPNRIIFLHVGKATREVRLREKRRFLNEVLDEMSPSDFNRMKRHCRGLKETIHMDGNSHPCQIRVQLLAQTMQRKNF